jgi:hypothetical protein
MTVSTVTLNTVSTGLSPISALIDIYIELSRVFNEKDTTTVCLVMLRWKVRVIILFFCDIVAVRTNSALS